jgi:hypothetical protein
MSMDMIPTEMLKEILVKLPTRDIPRCGRVSRLWRRAVMDSPPVLIHGKIYVVMSTYPLKFQNRPNMILEIDVVREAHLTHHLPD